jgi:transcriptional regulator with XRE-family HTH domain
LTQTARFRRQVADKFSAAISSRGLTKAEAAKILGVSRETLYQYLNARSTPGSDVLQRACEVWGITLNYRGLEFDSAAFGQSAKKSDIGGDRQLDLFAALNLVNDNSVDVTVIRKTKKSIELKVSLKFVS